MLSIAFSPDSSHIASGSDDKPVRIWDARTGMYLSSVKDNNIHELSAIFSASSTGIHSQQVDGDPGHCSYKLQLASPGWLKASGDISARFWLPVESYSSDCCHSSYKNSVVIGTHDGLLILFQAPLTTVQ